MQATPFYAGKEFDNETPTYGFEINGTRDVDTSVEDLVDVEIGSAEATNFSKSANRRTTDLVRL